MREAAEERLRTLPGLVVCGGRSESWGGNVTSEVWRLDLAKLQWERMPSLARERYQHACCAMRGRVVVLGGFFAEPHTPPPQTASVDMLGYDDDDSQWKLLPPLSCGPVRHARALAIDESESELGQVLLFGRASGAGSRSSSVHTVDLATGVCTPQPPLISHPGHSLEIVGCSAARLPDGRIVCTGKFDLGNQGWGAFARVLEPPEQGSPNGASWQ